MNELDWLTENRPEPPAPDTAWARASLLAHIEAAEAAPERVLAADVRRRSRMPLRLAAVGMLAAAALAAIVAWPAGDTRTPPVPGLHAPAPAEAALVKLSKKVAQAPDPSGDATLIIRSHHLANGHDFTGYDLYLDDGRYYFGQTREELKAAAQNSDYNDLVVKAALAARSLPPAAARQKMVDATWEGKEPAGGDEAAAPAVKAKLKGKTLRPVSEKSHHDNRIWFGSTDALLAGGGRPDVRAGVLLLLSTIDTVKVTEVGGTLKLMATDYPDGYTETYYVNAKTGVPEKFVGGVPGKAPDVTVTYEIKRVTAANWADAAA
jgi:hypothetical protein